jgi:hypothetical protein
VCLWKLGQAVLCDVTPYNLIDGTACLCSYPRHEISVLQKVVQLYPCKIVLYVEWILVFWTGLKPCRSCMVEWKLTLLEVHFQPSSFCLSFVTLNWFVKLSVYRMRIASSDMFWVLYLKRVVRFWWLVDFFLLRLLTLVLTVISYKRTVCEPYRNQNVCFISSYCIK